MAGEWVERSIAEIGDVVGGSTPSTKDATNFDGDIPWLTPKDLSRPHDRYVQRGERNLTEKGLAACSARLLPRNAVLLSSRAPIGYVAIAANPIATNQGFRSVVVNPEYDHEFLYYWLRANTDELERHATGTTFKELSGSALKRVRVRLPEERSEQRAIAHILGTLDDKIELNRRMTATLEAMARALFKSWFVDFDPVRAKAEGRDPGLPEHLAALFPDRLVESEMGEIPEGWKVVSLPTLMELNPRRSLRKGEAAPYLAMANMPTEGHAPVQVTQRPYGSGTRFVNGDTLLARITPCLENGKTAFIDFLNDDEVGWGSTEYIVLRPHPPVPEEFGYLLARDNRFRKFAIQHMTGTSGRQRVSASALEHYELVLPEDSAVFAALGAFVKPLLERSYAGIKESRTLAALRDILLPRLVSGALRVKDAETLIESVAP